MRSAAWHDRYQRHWRYWRFWDPSVHRLLWDDIQDALIRHSREITGPVSWHGISDPAMQDWSKVLSLPLQFPLKKGMPWCFESPTPTSHIISFFYAHWGGESWPFYAVMLKNFLCHQGRAIVLLWGQQTLRLTKQIIGISQNAVLFPTLSQAIDTFHSDGLAVLAAEKTVMTVRCSCAYDMAKMVRAWGEGPTTPSPKFQGLSKNIWKNLENQWPGYDEFEIFVLSVKKIS